MQGAAVRAVVVPVYGRYLDVLTARQHEITTMVYGWQGGQRRMVEPSQVLKGQGVLPLLYRSMEDHGEVSHAALSGLIVFRGSSEYQSLAGWLDKHRVERYAETEWGDDCTTFYLVTATILLESRISFQQLILAKHGRPLGAGMKRGYATVLLPNTLRPWYREAQGTWTALARKHYLAAV
jgi:hypothetical protein